MRPAGVLEPLPEAEGTERGRRVQDEAIVVHEDADVDGVAEADLVDAEEEHRHEHDQREGDPDDEDGSDLRPSTWSKLLGEDLLDQRPPGAEGALGRGVGLEDSLLDGADGGRTDLLQALAVEHPRLHLALTDDPQLIAVQLRKVERDARDDQFQLGRVYSSLNSWGVSATGRPPRVTSMLPKSTDTSSKYS